ncbi:MAG: radical SAM protein, partial [Nitrospirae bacterium]|nr:radical SAM protein [Nitrospirota bacterium]
ASVEDALEILRRAKQIRTEIYTVLGNVHATFCYEELLQKNNDFLDFIVRGEGEETVVDLVNCIRDGGDLYKVRSIAFWENNSVISTDPRPFIADLDNLPTAWDLIDWQIYTYKPVKDSTLAIVSSSRGCNQACSFCSQQRFWARKWRARSPENFVKELEYLRDHYGVSVVMLSDETPTLSRSRWERILDLLIEHDVGIKILMETRVDDIIRDEDIMWKYYKAGVDHIYVGVEATSQETLDMFNKNIKVEQSKRALDIINEYDIVSETSFVLGMPDDTPEKIRATVELAKYYNPDLAFFLAIAPWPYSQIYSQLKDYIAVHDYRKYNLVEPVVKPVNMTIEEVAYELGKASKDFYMYKAMNLDKMTSKKRDFMINVMKIIATSSYLAEVMKGEMPEMMKKMISILK